jgi:glycosyltransferase involved in cell wall biosynthesis
MTIQIASVGVIGAYHLSFVSSFAMTNQVNKKIKVLHLIKSLGRGGAEKLIPETALVHDQDRFEFYCLYFYHQQNNIVDELEAAGIQVQLIPAGNLSLFFQVKRVREFVAANQIDIIHAHLPWAGILSRFVGKETKIPIVYTEHNTWDRYNKVSYWGNRVTFKHQDVAIAVSNEVALSMQLNSIFDPYRRGGRLKVKVIQNGVNTEVFRRMSEDKKSASVPFNNEEMKRKENGEKGMENGEKRIENGEKRKENGEWRIENGEKNPDGVSPSPNLSISESPNLPISQSPNPRISPSPNPPISQSPNLRISESPNLPISQSPNLPISQSPNLPISPSPNLSISQSPNLPISESPNLRISQSPNLPISPSPNLKFQLGIPEAAKVIGKVAVFRSQKRLWIWVDLALKILERCPETHFLLVGDGDWRERIIAQIEKSGKQQNFHWVGVQKEVIPYLSIMDIYMSTSEFEGLPIAMLEAMSCEVPVVATSAGGIGEMVQHGVQGFLTGIDAYEGLVDFAVQLLEDPALHSQFAKAARARVVEKFSMKRMVRELEGVYDSVIARH